MSAPDGEFPAFDLYDDRWRDCWLAATSASRSRRKQVDLDIRQRVARLLEEHGPDSSRPLTLRIYGTMIKGCCVINNERVRALFVDCERVVLAFAKQPYTEGDSKLRLPASKRPRMEAALTLDLDLARVDASEAFDWTQAPLEEGALLRLGGGGGEGSLEALQQIRLDPNADASLLGPGANADPNGLSAWLPGAFAEEPQLPPPAAQEGGLLPPDAAIGAADPNAVPSQLVPSEGAEAPPGVELPLGATAAEAVALVVPLPRKHQKKELFLKPGVVYGFDDEPTLPPKEYESWQADCADITRPKLRAAAYSDRMAAEAEPAEHLAPRLGLLVDPAPGLLRPQPGAAGASGLGGAAPGVPGMPVMPGGMMPPPEGVPDGMLPPPGDSALALVPDEHMMPAELSELAEAAAAAVDGGMGRGGAGGAAEAQDDRTAEVGEIIRGCLRGSRAGAAHFHDLLPPGSAPRETAACTFSALLALATAGELSVSQEQPYGRIAIKEIACH